MSSDRWQKAQHLFAEALAKPEAARSEFLQRACGSDVVLRDALEALLRADQQADTFLETPVVRPESQQPAGERPRRIGPYRLLRQIGQGGMGTVFLAVRDDEAFDRRVVIKLVRGEAESIADIRRRLRTERRILASLDHPFIAKLFDGGTTEDGQPYFVMEYVDGVPIDEYCDQQRLRLEERLALFRKVCTAVHYAHQNLVVHRDLKPSNILVTSKGDPVLLDFGIAKVLNPELLSPEHEPTATWLGLLTPHYASPEQVRGKLVTTASDVYSLGVLLYKLLTDHLPHRFRGRSPREIEKTLMEEEPAKPSTFALPGAHPEDTLTRAPKAIARARSVGLAELRRQLSSDLDSIVMKALRSAPQQRYSSVEQLALDIDRLLGGLPVTAHRGTWRYRLGKLLRRRRGAAISGLLMLILAAAFSTALVRQWLRTQEERDTARLERDKATRRLNLMLDIFRVDNPYEGGGKAVTVHEALERSLPLLEHQLGEEPLTRAEILHTAGVIYTGLGSLDAAIGPLREALEIRRAILGDHHVQVAESAIALGVVQREKGNYGQAEELTLGGLETLRQVLGPQAPMLAPHLNQLVTLYCYRGDYANAAGPAQEAVELARRLPQEQVRHLAPALANLAAVRSAQDDYGQAADLYQRAILLERGRAGDRHPSLAPLLINLGVARRHSNNLEGATATYREALEIQEATLGPEHPELTPVLNNLAALAMLQGAHSSAESYYRRALAINRASRGQDHPWTFLYELRLASVWGRQGDAARAEPFIRQALERWQATGQEDRLATPLAEGVLGEALAAQGRLEEAEELLVRSFHALLESPRQRRKREALDRLAELHRLQNRPPEDLEPYRALLEKEAGP